MKQKKRKLYGLLSSILALLICSSAASFIRYQYHLEKRLEERTMTTIRDEADNSSAILQIMIEEYSSQLTYIKNLCKLTDPDRHYEILELLRNENKKVSYTTISFCDADGTLYIPDNGKINIANEAFFQIASASEKEKTYIDIGINPINKDSTIVLAEPIFSDGVFKGMVILYYNADAFLNSIGGQRLGNFGTLMLIHDNGQMLQKNGPIEQFNGYDEVLKDIPFNTEQERHKFVEAMENGNETIGLDGDNAIYYSPTKYPGWNLLLTINAAFIKQDFHAIKKDSIKLMIANIIIAALGGITVLFIYRVGKRILENNQLDSHTQLYNKIYAKRLAEEYISHEGRKKSFACFFLDMDHFKQVNDTLGHQIGDQLLKDFSYELKNHFRESDIVSRFGGDEFFILMKNVSDQENVRKKAQEVLNILPGIRNHGVTVSLGIAMYPIHGKTYDELQKRADIALYLAKEGGKNKYCFYQLDEA